MSLEICWKQQRMHRGRRKGVAPLGYSWMATSHCSLLTLNVVAGKLKAVDGVLDQTTARHRLRCQASQRETSSLPWTLMGRVVREDKIPFSQEQHLKLLSSAACGKSGLQDDVFYEKLQELLKLLPDLNDMVVRLHPDLLAELCKDTAGVAVKLVELRGLLPRADLSQIIMKRPAILLDKNYRAVPSAVATLHRLFPGASIDHMVMQQPFLLSDDLEKNVTELQRLMPGVDVAIMLLRNPSSLFLVQRGAQSLGPGAEFLMHGS